MKTLILSAVIGILSCINAPDKKVTDAIVLPSKEAQEILEPDTFIPVESKSLNLETQPDITDNGKNDKEKVFLEAVAPAKIKPIELVEPNDDSKSNEGAPLTTDDIAQHEGEASTSIETKPTKSNVTIVETETVLSTDNSITLDPTKQTEEKEPVISEPIEEEIPVTLITKPNHKLFAALLKKHVSSSGDVNYKGLKNAESSLDAYLEDLDANAPASDWTKNEKLAYWMNAYNAATIKLILKNYPVSKITDLHGGKPWDVKWVKLGGKTYSLNNIEHDIIRPTFKDPRIHFAVNCAAKSCPPLLNNAYTGENVNQELNKVTKAFVNSASNELSASSIKLSKIFEWYGEDFGNLIDFLNQYSSKSINSDAKIGYLDYNWSLNEG